MPDATEILHVLERTANGAVGVAIAWHAVLLAALSFAWGGWRPSYRLAGVLLTLPLVSVSVLAFVHGGFFNGAVFAALAMVLGAIGDRLPLEPVAGGSRWARVVGVLLVALAWTYPHFLDTPHAQTFLYAAPMGLVPCPTLALVAGIGLLTGGLRSPSWSLVVAGVTLFYGLFGALRLGVYLDGALVIAAVALAALALRLRRGKPSPEAGPPLPDDARASS